MILNNSRAEYFRACPQLAYNTDELRLSARRTASPLLIGGAFHKALAVINSKTGTLNEAADQAEAEYRLRANWTDLLKEERALAEQDIALVRSMARVYGEAYIEENYQMLAPEVKFCVPLTGSEHHCRYFHAILQRLYPTTVPDFKDCTGAYSIGSQGHTCFQPHYLTGTTDAVIQWSRAIWLQEHKTTAYDLYNDSPQSKNWIANWQLSSQASQYIYGIWKSTGVRPHGVLLNVIIKPRKNAANPQFKFYREAFLRTEDQLNRYAQQMIWLANEYESRMASGQVWQNSHNCFNYNRQCDFHESCISGHIEPGRFIIRPADYVNLAYYKVLGIDPPQELTEVKEEQENHVIE